MLPKAHWLLIPGCLALGEWSHHRDYLGHEYLFYIVLICNKQFSGFKDGKASHLTSEILESWGDSLSNSVIWNGPIAGLIVY